MQGSDTALEIDLHREPSQNSTPGLLSFNGLTFYTLEDIERGGGDPLTVSSWKVDKESAIPRGRYEIINSMSKRFGKVLPEIKGVDGFTGVRVHGGNKTKDTDGCVLAGLNRGPDMIWNCEKAVTAVINAIAAAAKEGRRAFITIH